MHIDCADPPKFNGLDIDERKEYVRLHTETCIEKSIEKLNFKAHVNHIKTPKAPITEAAVKELEDNCKPISDEETRKLEKSHGFKCRTMIGILLFAFTACRVDIGHAISNLS